MKLIDLAAHLGAELRAATANPEILSVSNAAAATPASLVFAEDERSLAEALSSPAGAVLVHPKHALKTSATHPLLFVRQPRLAFAQAASLLRLHPVPSGVHSSAVIAPGVSLGPSVSVGAHAVLETGAVIGARTVIEAGVVVGAGVHVGQDCHLYPRVVLYPGVTLGDRVVVHAGAVLGADGFGYVRDSANGRYTQFPQQGTLLLEDDVEVGANSTIDRGALQETRIHRGVKIDNLVHIGHNVQVGEDVVIAALTGISGSSTIGKGAVIAGQVGIADHVTIGEGAILGAQCGVPSHKKLIGSGQLFWGTPAQPIHRYLKQLAHLARLGQSERETSAVSGTEEASLEEKKDAAE